jgi:hypothetical protein
VDYSARPRRDLPAGVRLRHWWWCDGCGGPLQPLMVPYENRREERTHCARCTGETLANPCRVRGCLGVSISKRGVGICSACKDIRKSECNRQWMKQNPQTTRRLNRESYERHKDALLAKRRQRRLEVGDGLRKRERRRREEKARAQGRPFHPRKNGRIETPSNTCHPYQGPPTN